MKKILLGFVILLATVVSLSAQSQSVTVEVDGLSCPFCAYGLEKNFKEIKGVENIKIDVKEGLLTFTTQDEKTVSEEVIRKTVKKAGFTPRKITFAQTNDKKEDDE